MLLFEGEAPAALLTEGATLAPIIDVLVHLDYMKQEEIGGEID
jgi:hypothetical protein